MEGLIPFVYRAILQYKNGGQGVLGTWPNESPSASYVRLCGDSGRFSTSDHLQLFRPDCDFSASTPPPSPAKRDVFAVTRSPRQLHLTNSCRDVK
ncbi:hypothetical protein PHJA_002624700 [Phtheirospermum japonicum]|uniref:Uncharacterized protein n=1 Tax=Phtheirospermum japonicum TaxID=374723 RepID=A0A830CZQ7_9LAMI|nr:hypothetical protein PHJA_002624700 [Phtheirospermum japonicum]